MTPRTALRLGRVSNLLTVWTDLAAGAALAGGAAPPAAWACAGVGAALVYVAGMFLNDAFDAPHDARGRPDRPIPAGQAGQGEVFGWGFALLAAGVAAILLAGAVAGRLLPAMAAALALAGLVVAYDRHHKGNPFGPAVMAACRAGLYAVAGAIAAGRVAPPLAAGAVVLACHLAALTFIAKHELAFRWRSVWPLLLLAVPVAWALPTAPIAALALLAADGAALALLRRRGAGDGPRAIATLIAAIALVDAALIAGTGQPLLALAAAAGFPATLALQRLVAGT